MILLSTMSNQPQNTDLSVPTNLCVKTTRCQRHPSVKTIPPKHVNKPSLDLHMMYWTIGHVHYNTIGRSHGYVKLTHQPWQRRHPTIISSSHHNNNPYCCILYPIYTSTFCILTRKEPCFYAACMLLTICCSFSEYIVVSYHWLVSVSLIDSLHS